MAGKQRNNWWGESWQDWDEAGLCQLLQQTACELSLPLPSKQCVLWQDSREEPIKKNAVTIKESKALKESLLSISHVHLLSISHVYSMSFLILLPAVEFQQDGGRRRYPERCPEPAACSKARCGRRRRSCEGRLMKLVLYLIYLIIIMYIQQENLTAYRFEIIYIYLFIVFPFFMWI